ncbi:ethD domain-containing protein [Sarocladium implicatum]|nr:ethD domain-containing protein [Sarocladium implicatum]
MAFKDPRSEGHVKIDHKFNFPKFDYEIPIDFQPCIKMMFFFSKDPNVSYEHFSKHYAHIHSDLTVAASSFGAFNVQRYTQVHAFPELREKAKSLGYDVDDWDGCSTLYFKEFDDAQNFFQSKDHKSLGEDCKHFMDLEKGVKVVVGKEMICFGKGIPGVDATDGITEYKK